MLFPHGNAKRTPEMDLFPTPVNTPEMWHPETIPVYSETMKFTLYVSFLTYQLKCAPTGATGT